MNFDFDNISLKITTQYILYISSILFFLLAINEARYVSYGVENYFSHTDLIEASENRSRLGQHAIYGFYWFFAAAFTSYFSGFIKTRSWLTGISLGLILYYSIQFISVFRGSRVDAVFLYEDISVRILYLSALVIYLYLLFLHIRVFLKPVDQNLSDIITGKGEQTGSELDGDGAVSELKVISFAEVTSLISILIQNMIEYSKGNMLAIISVLGYITALIFNINFIITSIYFSNNPPAPETSLFGGIYLVVVFLGGLLTFVISSLITVYIQINEKPDGLYYLSLLTFGINFLFYFVYSMMIIFTVLKHSIINSITPALILIPLTLGLNLWCIFILKNYIPLNLKISKTD